MTTQQIIDEVNRLQIRDPDDDETLDKVYELCSELRNKEDGYVACTSLINLLERHPSIEFGSPGEPVNTLEHFMGHYEHPLFESLKRQPTTMTVWMLNRIINGEKNAEKKDEQLALLKSCICHKLADQEAKDSARDFLNFQLGM